MGLRLSTQYYFRHSKLKTRSITAKLLRATAFRSQRHPEMENSALPLQVCSKRSAIPTTSKPNNLLPHYYQEMGFSAPGPCAALPPPRPTSPPAAAPAITSATGSIVPAAGNLGIARTFGVYVFPLQLETFPL